VWGRGALAKNNTKLEELARRTPVVGGEGVWVEKDAARGLAESVTVRVELGQGVKDGSKGEGADKALGEGPGKGGWTYKRGSWGCSWGGRGGRRGRGCGSGVGCWWLLTEGSVWRWECFCRARGWLMGGCMRL